MQPFRIKGTTWGVCVLSLVGWQDDHGDLSYGAQTCGPSVARNAVQPLKTLGSSMFITRRRSPHPPGLGKAFMCCYKEKYKL